MITFLYGQELFNSEYHMFHYRLCRYLCAPNQDYLVPYTTVFLVYITVRAAVSWTAFTMETMICKAVCDDPIRQRLKAAFVFSGACEFGGPWGRGSPRPYKQCCTRVMRKKTVNRSMPVRPDLGSG